MRIIFLSLLLAAAFVSLGCGGNSNAGSANSPTEAYKKLFAAVKSKNTDAIKQAVTKTTQDFAAFVSDQQKKPIEQVYENGFTATTFADKLPEIRDERIDGNSGAVEVWNSKESRWEDLPFVLEDGSWKLGVGDLFKGSWKLPGKGRAVREQEAANAAGGGAAPALPAANADSAPNMNADNQPMQRRRSPSENANAR